MRWTSVMLFAALFVIAAAAISAASGPRPAPPTPPPTPVPPDIGALIADGRCDSPRRAGAPSAFTALRLVMPELAARHPNGHLVTLFGSALREDPGKPIRRWAIRVFDPDRGVAIPYTIDNGVLQEDGRSDTSWKDSPPLISLTQQQLATGVRDSHEIASQVDALGGRTYCEQTASSIVWMELRGKTRHGPLVWQLTYRFGGGIGTGLELVLDATSGQLLTLINKDQLFSPLP